MQKTHYYFEIQRALSLQVGGPQELIKNDFYALLHFEKAHHVPPPYQHFPSRHEGAPPQRLLIVESGKVIVK